MYGEGDAEAFDVLFDRHRGTVFHFARMMLGSRDGAEDVFQETFLAVARSAKRYQPRQRFRAWLLRIARNVCINRIQADRARRRVLRQSGLDVIEPASDEPPPPERLASKERMGRLRAEIEGLPERQREALVLYAFEQMGYREIGEVLGVPIGTVKTLIHRARAALARAMETR
jgi:RNA polymerase sigma-70 factor (ECF subfamily)